MRPLGRIPFDVDIELQKAVELHRSGQLREAETIYRQILERHPSHSRCLHLLGVILHQFRQADAAEHWMNKAIQHDPRNPEYYCDLGNVLRDQGKFNEAISCHQKALELQPNNVGAYNNMGIVFQRQGNPDEAVSCYEKAIELQPDLVEAYGNLGNALKDQGKLNEAISCYQKALELQPNLVPAFNNMGVVFRDQGKFDEALSCYERTIELQPNHVGAYNNMGIVFQRQGEFDNAVSCYEKAIELQPDLVEAYDNLGLVLQEQGRFEAAASSHRKALDFKEDSAETYRNLGLALEQQGKSDEAVSCYKEALRLKLDYAEACSNLICQLQETCAWQELRGLIEELNSSTRIALQNATKTAETPFVSITLHADPPRNFAVARSWSRELAKAASSSEAGFAFDARKSTGTNIVIGYLSNDFRNHAVAHVMLSLFGVHDRSRFRINCYSYGIDDGSHYRKRIERDCDKFVDVHHLSHFEAAKRIYEDHVDILVDLNGYTWGNRLAICAFRPAPVQVTYLGFPGTVGAPFSDYIITDRIVTPEDEAIYYSENFVYMPQCYMVNDHGQEISKKDQRKADFGLPEKGFVFCSFNDSYKIEPVIFDVWMEILRTVPQSVLWLRRGKETAQRNLRREAKERGINPERLIFSGRLPSKEDHLGRLSLADLALDTRIYNGHATTSDALWAGVPVVALKGNHFASRASASLLTAIGLPELIVESLEEYKNLGVRLAKNPSELQAIRQRLAGNRSKEPLFDTPRFARNLETAYEEMWKIFLAGERPRRIEVLPVSEKGGVLESIPAHT